MHFRKILILFAFIVQFIDFGASIEPITIGVLSIVAGIGSVWWYGGEEGKVQKTVDKVKYLEFCTSGNIKYDMRGLKADLESNLFGQHIVNTALLAALRSHVNNLERSEKPLVLSFHGTPGTGKNYVADMIIKNFYRLGDNSRFVHRYRGRIDFPLESEVNLYRVRLKNEIMAAIGSCERSVFVFDEVEKMPPGVFESIASLLDHHNHVGGIDFRKSIFIFLSNAGGSEIAKALENLMANGKYREQTALHDFEQIAERAAYNVDGGLQKASMITSSLVDHFIPFLPLERRHVQKCVHAEFRKLQQYPADATVNLILDNYVSYNGIFSKFGCKRLNKKVAVLTDALLTDDSDE